MAENNEFLTYKGKPLVRSGKKIYYGNMADGYVCEMTIESAKDDGGIQMSDRVSIRLLCTDPTCPPAEMIVNKSEKNNLGDALEIASIWLERKLKEEAAN